MATFQPRRSELDPAGDIASPPPLRSLAGAHVPTSAPYAVWLTCVWFEVARWN